MDFALSASEGKRAVTSHDFFQARREQSRVKAAIVSKYFGAWATIMASQVENRGDKIAYLDLFAGPGRYKDGSESTPILILELAIKNEKIGKKLIALFNDIDKDNIQTLQNEIDALPGINTLKYKPELYNTEVDTEAEVVEELIKRLTAQKIPTLFFADPWGYKGLSLQLISSILKNWGCDCIFFFNYNRINMGLSNPLVAARMKDIFGENRAEELRTRLDFMRPIERELAIIDDFTQALRDIGGTYVFPFHFKDEHGTRTTHHLIFVCKHQRGFTIMKEIMAKVSSTFQQGVPSFSYSPTEARSEVQQLTLFPEKGPLDELEEGLLSNFTGRSVTIDQIFREHHLGKRYLERNYYDALINLETRGEITADIPIEKRKKRNGKIVLKGVVFTFFLPRTK